MRYVEGTALKTVIRDEGPLPPADAVDLVEQAAGALDLAHGRGLVHRDVKPGNILLAREGRIGEARHVYLSDFGLTKQATSESGLTETGHFVGTAEYIAPEQIEHGDVGGWSDVYALTCVLFECLTGEPPFRRDSLMAMLWAHVHDPPPAATERRPGLPKAIDAVLARGLAKAPRDRYATCGELAADARHALGLGAAAPPRPRPLEQLARRPALALAGLAAAAVLLALVLGALLLRGGEDGPGPTTALVVDSLQRIDPASGDLEATIPLGSVLHGVAAGGGSVWAIDGSSRFRRIDVEEDAVAATGSTAGVPAGIAVGLGAVWIANLEGSTATTGTVTEVDASSGRVRRVLPIAVRQAVPNEPTFSDIAVDDSASSGRAVWVASPFSLSVMRIRPRLGSTVATVPIGATTSRRLAVGEGAVWVTTNFAVVRIDPAQNAVVERIPLPFDPRDVAAGAGAVWIANGTGNSVWVLDPQTNRVIDRIPVGNEPVALALGAGAVWTANRRDGTVSRIDPERGAVTRTIEVGGFPDGVAVGASGVWVAAHGDPGADGELTEREYLTVLESITAEAQRLAYVAFEPFVRTLGSRSSIFRLELGPLPPRLGQEVVEINRAQIAELGELEPPERFAADHARYVAGLRELGRLTERLAETLTRRQNAEAEAVVNEINTTVGSLRWTLSSEFRAAVPYFPLACC
jgi:serine/threonine-protein kinase